MKRIVKTLVQAAYDSLFFLVVLVAIPLVPLRLLNRKLGLWKMVSLWSGSPILNMGINARAERLLGVNARSLVYTTYFITREFDYDLSRWFSVPLIGKLVPFPVFLWACLTAERLHFYCDRGLIPSLDPFRLNELEFMVYRLLRIPVFFWTYGADVRAREVTRALGEPNCCTECTLVGRACICDDRKQKRHMERLRRYATAVFSMGDMIEYTPGSRNDLFFWPIDHRQPRYDPAYPATDAARPLRIVHSPNHPMFKGTHFLVEAVETLKGEGVNIELVMVQGVPNTEALEMYRTADVIFDGCLIGFHGFLAIEGMTMGKAVMCNIRKPENYLLTPEECPIISCHPDTLRDDLRRLAENRELVHERGVRGREYIEKYFTLEAYAERLACAYRDAGVPL